MKPHTNQSCRILVVGATGNTGRPIAAELTERGFTVRTATPHAPPPEHHGEHVHFDWQDAKNHDAVIAGVDRMYLIAPGLVEAPEHIMIPFIARAVARGVRRVVVLSAAVVAEGAPGLGRVHQFLHQHVPEWTVLQPSWFMQNFSAPRHHLSQSIKQDGVMITATGEGRLAFVDARDIAAVGARALADDTPHNTAHVITGPAALSYRQVAALLSQATGRDIRHQAVDVPAMTQYLMRAGMPAAYARFLAELDELIRQGQQSQVTSTVLQVTGHEPRTIAAFVQENAAYWQR